MRLLFSHDADVAQWVASQIPHLAKHLGEFEYGKVFGPCAAIGVIDRNGHLVGGVVYHNWNRLAGNIELSFAATSPKWLTRDIVRALLRYPFDQANCRRVTGLTPRRATSARRFLDQFGFKREGCIREGFGDDHAIVSGLLRSEWEAHPLNQPRLVRHGKERSIAPSA